MIAQCQRAVQAALDDGVPPHGDPVPGSGGLDTAPGDATRATSRTTSPSHTSAASAPSSSATRPPRPPACTSPTPSSGQMMTLTGAAPTPDGVRPPEDAQTKARSPTSQDRWITSRLPDFLSVSGLDKLLNKRVTLDERVKPTDTGFVVAVPEPEHLGAGSDEGTLRRRETRGRTRPVIVCNGELERTRSNAARRSGTRRRWVRCEGSRGSSRGCHFDSKLQGV